MDITKIPTQELLDDLASSITDKIACESALLVGVKQYSGGKVQERIDGNQFIIGKIQAELFRRGVVYRFRAEEVTDS